MLENFKTYQIAKEYHALCLKQRIPYYLRDQLYRASSSIALNLAEGAGKQGPKDQKRFYSIALGSLRECQAICDLANCKTETLHTTSNKLAAHLLALLKTKKHKT